MQGAPVGSLVVGEQGFVHRVRRARKALGGGWRQAGVLAACGIIALENMEQTLRRDHDLAKSFSEGISNIPGVSLLKPPETNLVLFNVQGKPIDDFVDKASRMGLDVGSGYGNRGNLIRAVVHKDISPTQVEQAVDIVRQAMA